MTDAETCLRLADRFQKWRASAGQKKEMRRFERYPFIFLSDEARARIKQ